MTDQPTFQGALQAAVMRALWEIDGGTVQAVRDALPPEGDHAYTTIQTVLNRLVERGLVERKRTGVAYEYRAALAEPDYVSGMIGRLLDDASPSARAAAIAQLVGGLEPGERETLEGLATQVRDRRSKGREQ